MISGIISAALAVPAFAVIFDVNLRELLFCSLAGLAAEGTYQSVLLSGGNTASALLTAAAALCAVSRILANRRRMPVTVYLVPGVIPLVPGAGMYNTVFNMIASDYSAAVRVGFDTAKAAAAVAIGIAFVFALPNKIFFKRKK